MSRYTHPLTFPVTEGGAGFDATYTSPLSQVVKGLQRCPGPVHLLCARSQDSSVTEVQLTDNNNIISHECHAHVYKHSTLRAAAPSAECWQHVIAEMAAANTADHTEDFGFVDHRVENVHVLYEWIGAISCGIQSKASKEAALLANF